MEICVIILKGIVAFSAAVGAAWVGILVYFRQKEYEIVKNRYLDEGIDLIVAEHEMNLGIQKHNWARCLNILKSFRDTKKLFDLSELDNGFIEFNSSQFHVIAHHRLQNLVGSTVYWEVFQLGLSYVTTSNSVITKEIPNLIRLKLTTEKVDKSFEELVNYSLEELKRIDEESHKHSSLSNKLLRLTDMLEREKLSFAKIEEFCNQQAVKELTKQLDSEFRQELAEAQKIA